MTLVEAHDREPSQVARADDLQAGWKAAGSESAGHARGRLLGHVERVRIGSPTGPVHRMPTVWDIPTFRERGDRQGRREQQIVGLVEAAHPHAEIHP